MTIDIDTPDAKPEAAARSGAAFQGRMPAHLPVALPSLEAAEALFLAALRNFALGPVGWEQARREIWLACGLSQVEPVLAAFERLVSCRAVGARRPPVYLLAGAPGISADELALANLVAAAQSGAFVHTAALARWLVVPGEQARLVSAATRLGAGLAASGLRLRHRRAVGAADFRLP